MIKSKTRFKLSGMVFLLLFTLILGGLFLIKRIGTKPKATAGVPSLTYSIEPSAVAVGQNHDLILKVNPNGASFYAFELYTTYDPVKVEFQNNTDLAANITSSYMLTSSAIDTSSNTITVIGTRTGSAFTGSTDQEIARVKIKVKSGATGDIAFNWGANTRLAVATIDKVNGTFTIGGGGSGQGPKLFIDVPSVPPDPATGVAAVQQGQNVDVQVFLTTAGKDVKSLDVYLPYDDTRLDFQNTSALVQNIVVNNTAGFDPTFIFKNIDTAQKKITIGLVAPTSNGNVTPVNGDNILLATIKFKIKSNAPDGVVGLIPETSSRIYDLQTQPILDCVGGFKLTVGQGSGPTDTPIPGASDTPVPDATDTPVPDATDTPIPGGGSPTTDPNAVYLNFKIRFQGIMGKPNKSADIPVRVTVNSIDQGVTRAATARFKVNNGGNWTGQVMFNNLPPASDYKIFVKGPKHLQKRICERTPSETYPGSYSCENGSINLQPGNFTFNFANILLMVGDLPQQDGLVNSYDISLVRNNIGVVGSQTPAVLALADLNLDGIVDSQDYSLVIASLSIRADEGP